MFLALTRRAALPLVIVALAGSAYATPPAGGTGDVWPAIRINFQLDGTPVPCGYSADTGRTFGLRKDGNRFGWNFDHSDVTRDRGIVKNQVLDTLSHFHKKGRWEIEVPNGWHEIHVGIGDAEYGSTHFLYVEGIPFYEDTYLAPKDFRHVRHEVLVTDGRLTLDQDEAWDKATRINFVEIDAPEGPPPGCSDVDDDTDAESDEPEPGGTGQGNNDGGGHHGNGNNGSDGPPSVGGVGTALGPRPYGLKGLKGTFGRRCNKRANDARTYYPSSGGRGKNGYVYYHAKLARKVGNKVLKTMKRQNRTKAVDYGVWGYACRLKTGGTSWSVHSWGAAIDTNTLRNPYGAKRWDGRGSNGKRYGRYYPNLWLEQGFYWGINFRDPMHFQYVSGY